MTVLSLLSGRAGLVPRLSAVLPVPQAPPAPGLAASVDRDCQRVRGLAGFDLTAETASASGDTQPPRHGSRQRSRRVRVDPAGRIGCQLSVRRTSIKGKTEKSL